VRQALAIVAGAALALVGGVVLGEYDLRGATVVIGFPLYGVAVAELALAVCRRLSVGALAVLSLIVAAGLALALWIAFGHFRNDVTAPVLSWVMVVVSAAATFGWGRAGLGRRSPAAAVEETP